MHLLFLQFHALICQVAPPPLNLTASVLPLVAATCHGRIIMFTLKQRATLGCFFSKVALKNFDLHSIRLLYQTIGDNSNKPGDKCNNL